jgi:hypothetical protein
MVKWSSGTNPDNGEATKRRAHTEKGPEGYRASVRKGYRVTMVPCLPGVQRRTTSVDEAGVES